MRWFERYGIPGIYFVLLFAIFYWIILGFPFEEITTKAFATAASASLPIGYILTIISQWIYYCRFFPRSWQLHRKAWCKAGNNPMPEEEVEAKVAILGRLKIKNNESNKRRWLQEWFTKRMDVLAINNSLILATVICWLFAIGCLLAGLLACGVRERIFPWLEWYCLLFLFGVTVVIILSLILSDILLGRQVSYALVGCLLI